MRRKGEGKTEKSGKYASPRPGSENKLSE